MKFKFIISILTYVKFTYINIIYVINVLGDNNGNLNHKKLLLQRISAALQQFLSTKS